MACAHPHVGASRLDAVIFDVDGTLCDVRHVRHFVEAPLGAIRFKPNFDLFHAGSIDCPPHVSVKELAIRVRSAGLAVVVVTGREAKWAALTVEWMNKHDIPFDELRTRGVKDYRADQLVKSDIEISLSEHYRALLAVDDRPDIIQVWQSAGIPTALVRPDGEILPAQAPTDSAIDDRVRRLLKEEAAR